MQELYNQTSATATRSAEVSKVLRNTYMLLAITMAVSAVCAALSIAIGLGRGTALMMSLGALALVWFVLPRTANSSSGLWVVFGFVALLGASLGPTLSYYLQMPNGSTVVMQALGGTALVFFGLSGYVLTTGKDFTFMGGFLFIGLIVAIVAMLALFGLSFFGIQVSGAHLAISAVIVLLMSGFILYDTSRIITGGETNYILATVALYLNIYNLFTSLLHLLGAFGGDD
ncbi:Bax inhibitor-1/YccA family protein [Simiduia sp. 21SJ11W-1]|uniref:Bax inhibitor-1/YccA family protein n=1 Tax=Simiduia sp. 21SJ11W-1 TaxID=2909669 RepID=UPI00209F1B64|nr:Bax inhibitor-1/YccA family protein [Simiduia sp. 21SJ11W-1]UTA46351.1 Bax inhibitor-1/YccA family protein [Simiduia sp. 21SJ11W-1]